MTSEELKKKGAIYFENICVGLNQYKDEKMVLNKEEALSHFQKLIQQHGQENSYVDFYYYRLDANAQHVIEQALTEEERTYLEKIRPDKCENMEEEIIFPLTEELLEIVVKLNAGEILFSTLYFAVPARELSISEQSGTVKELSTLEQSGTVKELSTSEQSDTVKELSTSERLSAVKEPGASKVECRRSTWWGNYNQEYICFTDFSPPL